MASVPNERGAVKGRAGFVSVDFGNGLKPFCVLQKCCKTVRYAILVRKKSQNPGRKL